MYEYNEQTLSGPTYMDVYWYRNNKYGTNHKEREYNYGIRNFEKYLNEIKLASEAIRVPNPPILTPNNN